jgi:dolichol-phosphate mannosyltransferase
VRAARGEWIATLDGDGQNDPADIAKLVAARDAADAASNLWLVTGYRRRRQDAWLKRFSSRVANGVRSRLLGDATPDTGCGLKLILRQAVLELPVFDHMHRFLPALIQRNGGATLSVEVNHRPRTRGRSNYGVFDRLWIGIIDLIGMLWLKRRALRPQARELPRP